MLGQAESTWPTERPLGLRSVLCPRPCRKLGGGDAGAGEERGREERPRAGRGVVVARLRGSTGRAGETGGKSKTEAASGEREELVKSSQEGAGRLGE